MKKLGVLLVLVLLASCSSRGVDPIGFYQGEMTNAETGGSDFVSVTIEESLIGADYYVEVVFSTGGDVGVLCTYRGGVLGCANLNPDEQITLDGPVTDTGWTGTWEIYVPADDLRFGGPFDFQRR